MRRATTQATLSLCFAGVLIACAGGSASAQSRPGLAYGELRRNYSQAECLQRAEAAARSLRLQVTRSQNQFVWANNATDTVLMVCNRRAEGTFVKVIVAASNRNPTPRKDELLRLIDRAPATATQTTPPRPRHYGTASSAGSSAPSRPRTSSWTITVPLTPSSRCIYS